MENEWSLWFHLQGLIIGIATFLIIGLFHPLVVKAEYYWGTNSRWAFFALGIIGIIASIWVNNLLVSALCGVRFLFFLEHTRNHATTRTRT